MNNANIVIFTTFAVNFEIIMRKFIRLKAVIIFLMLCATIAMGQSQTAPTTVIRGIVRDSVSNEPLSFVAIFLKGTDKGALSKEDGTFEIVTRSKFESLNFNTMGYDEKVCKVEFGKVNDIEVLMSPVGVALKELVVKPKKEKYSKKNNPAVAFVEKLMKRKHLHDPKSNDYFSYRKYEKMNLGLNDFSEKQKKNWIFKKFKFIFDYVDTSEVSGKPVLNVSVKEKISDVYFRKHPSSEKEYVRGIKRAGLDEAFDEESVQRFLDDIFREIDIFGNDVTMLQNRFVSPLSNIGTNFYKYYLSDTIPVDGVKCIELSFVPFTPQAFGFLGRIYVPLEDSTMFIKKVKLDVPKSINLNYVQNMYIEQDYEKAPDGSRIKVKDDMTVEFQILPSTQGLYARRNTSYKDFSFEAPEDENLFKAEGKTIVSDEAQVQPDEFWQENRITPIKSSENQLSKLLTRLRSVPVYYWTEKVVLTLITGYLPTRDKDSKFDFGPMNTTISGNTLEGARFRVGGITTANLHPNIFARGYLAYGTRDEKLKYQAELEYSFVKKKYHSREWPIHSIKLSHLYDVDKLGQHYLFTNMDNVFLAWKRKKDDKMSYLRRTRLEYLMERKGGFSLKVGFSHEIEEASKFIKFIDGYGNYDNHYTEAGFDITLRYAPGEKFYQSKTNRYPINLDAPVFLVKHTFMPKGFLGSKFTVNKTEVSVQKRFWFSAFGYTDIILKGAKVWSEVPFPNLLLPNANLSYTVQPESFSLMNALEFANDQYLSWDLTYWANGALFNRIPLIKYLKLREVISFRGLYGSLEDKNNPEHNNKLYRFPYAANCQPMGKVPYMEFGVGIDNIFTFLRLDYVWRLTYRDTPSANLSGLRVQLHFTF